LNTKHYDRGFLEFLLKNVLKVEELFQYEYFQEHDLETLGMTLDTAEAIAEKHLTSAFVDSDRNEPQLSEGKVKVHPKIKDFLFENHATGLLTSSFSYEYEGQQLPAMVYGAANYILNSSHNSFVMYSDLIHGCSEMLIKFGSESLRKGVLPNLLGLKWLGSMCLTEPQAGSSLSEIITSASPQKDGTYKIKGQKIFISAGDQDISENIVHLVLARIEGAPKGAKGISLFVVPKNKIDLENGTLLPGSPSNDVQSVGIFHKMGQKATPAMHLVFGDNDSCTGYLLGQENKGLSQMFVMMNGARLGVGMTGISIASAAYQLSLEYAQERKQGKIGGDMVKIIEHADVKRMLLSQKAVVEGGLCLLMRCYKYLDLSERTKDPKYLDLAELLTPVAKTLGAELGFKSANQGLQVLGGYGYTSDFKLEQLVRDARICSIYEGTTGIHSLALMGREILKSDGASLTLWQNEVNKTIEKALNSTEVAPYAEKFQMEINTFIDTNKELLKKVGTKEYLADATIYMELFALLNMAWQWIDIASEDNKEVKEDHLSRFNTLRYFFKYEFPKTNYLTQILLNPERVTV
jgi:alkylation response protein AidB-like acyl-CoA dehydrogenase